MSLKSLINDPEFGKLSTEEQKQAVVGIEPEAGKLNPDEYSTFIGSLKTAAAPPPTTSAAGANKPVGVGGWLANEARGAWEDLKVPAQKSKEGLKIITDAGVKAQNWLANKTGLPIGTEPTGNLLRDWIANEPRIAGETLAEVAPSFVSRGAMVTGGILKGASAIAPKLAPAAKFVAGEAEKQSGLINKGKELLTKAYNEPTLMFGPGTKAANKMYDEIQGGNQQIRPSLKYTAEPIKFIKKVMIAANNGTATTDEALEARHYLDGIKDSVTGAFYRNARGVLDYIAKQDYGGADAAYQRAAQSEALRSFSSFNVPGTPSIGRFAAMLLKPASAVAFSPFVQSGVASALGAIAKGGAALGAVPGGGAAAYGVADAIGNIRKRKASK